MARAGVFIGVDQTGTLQKLNDAAAGARRMYQWALTQGIADKTHAKLITDAGGAAVEPGQIYREIKSLIDGPGVEQLILYFAGHGVNLSRNEYWLLTEAPVRTSAAVNVSGSVELARYCGIRHVVIISDACRVAPEGIQAQNVRGEDVFPNEGRADKAQPVDQFFACFLGRTAAELRDPATAAGNYSALYTGALLDALKGLIPDAVQPSAVAGEKYLYVRPRPLQASLEIEVPRRVKERQLEKKVNQNPDAIITSDGSWLSRLDLPDGGLERLTRPVHRPPPAPRAPDVRDVSKELVASAVQGDRAAVDRQLAAAKTSNVTGVPQLAGVAERLATPFGPDHFETQCGVKVRGRRIVDFFATRATAEIGTAGDVLRIHRVEAPAASVILWFDGGVGTVIPAIPEFIAALTFDDEGDLVDVSYEPSANTWRWDIYKSRAGEVRALRAVAASSSQQGRFRLNQSDAENIAQRMQYAKGVDPTLAVYAAYAYSDLQAIDRIRSMSGYLKDDLGTTFFDLALLARSLIDKAIRPEDAIVPFVPLLSQGWALLGAHRVRLHKALKEIEGTRQDSLWSLFNAAGLDMLRQALSSGEVR